LGSVLKAIESGRSFQTLERAPAGDELGVLKVSAVSWKSFNPNEAKAVIGHTPSEHHRVRKGDILISRANTRDLVGSVVHVDKDYPNRLLSDKTLRLIVDEDRINPEFLVLALWASDARTHIESFATGTSDSMRNIGQSVIRSVPIPFMPIEEQRHIATRVHAQLASAETARFAAEAQIKEIELLPRMILANAFGTGLCAARNPTPISINPSDMDAPSGWNWFEIKNLARLESGHTPSRSRPDWWGGDVSWISLTEIRLLDGRWTEETRIKTNADGIAHSAARILPRGTVCLSRTASVGFVTIMANPMATSQDFANWVCGDALDPEFLMYALICSREHLRSLATGATHKTIYMPTLEQFRICAPPRPEQERIVRRLRDQLAVAESARLAAEAQLKEIQRLPERILATAFGDGERAA
jgi:type I restriction enzyme S subunit